MGLFSFIGGLIGRGKQKKASRKAEAAQLELLGKALAEERANRDQIRGDLTPFRETGVDALGQQGDLLGLNGPEAQAVALGALRESPLFSTVYDTGEEAILANASATGGLRGGNTQRSLADFGADTFTRVLMEQLAQLGGLSGRGQDAATQGGALSSSATDAIARIFGQQGQVRAGGLLTRGGISAGMWNNAGAFLDDAVKSIFPGGFKF